MSAPIGPVFAALFTGFQVGAALVASRYVIDQTTPATLAMLRYSIGFLCLIPFISFAKNFSFRPRDLLPICILGVFQFGVLVALLNYALQYLPSARVALIFATFPLQTMILAAIFGKEPLSRYKTIGVLLSIAGVVIALGESLFLHEAGANKMLAIAAVGLSAFTGAICSIFYRPYLERYPAQNISTLAMFASVVVLLLFSTVENGLNTIGNIDFEGWLAVSFIGVSSGAGYFAWLWALKSLSPTRVTMFLSLGPITSAVLGGIFLSEPITLYLILGIVLVISGLWLGLKNLDAKKAPE
ncbi:hypothetical protein A9Q83_11830 [Alphaproteobacteria bacterium 46_93_T64]|nr:hypothetical protein A9Q83_11830 [Alphaproteobacteria bacterium 46_93_T64]